MRESKVFHSKCSVCSLDRAALMTEKYQQHMEVEKVVTANSHREVDLSLNEVPLAEELEKHGNNTGMFGNGT